ncbi:MAG: arginase [Neomegalonema sp.]|nr:arginase [Neomegalonema sp.]
MGPDALRIAGLATAIAAQGITVQDEGDLRPSPMADLTPSPSARNLPEAAAFVRATAHAAYDAVKSGATPIILGGDHVIAAGSVAGLAAAAQEDGERLAVLWFDAHPDFHTAATTDSGNMHGMAAAYFCGDAAPPADLAALYGDAPCGVVDPQDLTIFGARSIDHAEGERLRNARVNVIDMRAIDEVGVGQLMQNLTVKLQSDAKVRLHVSFDVDFLDPDIAPGVGTTVPGGATFREAHLAMELLADSGLVRSVDIVELNPFLDERGRTARLLVDLAASLFGKRVMDRPTRTRW